jgi:hypothetical protein
MTYGLEERHIINESYRTAKEYRRGQGEVEKPPGRLVDNGTEWTFSKRDLAWSSAANERLGWTIGQQRDY